MIAKIFYFRNRNELRGMIEGLKNRFLNGEGQFIYFDQDNKLLVISDSFMEGQDAYIISGENDIIDLLRGYSFRTFAVRSKRRNSMQDNRRFGEIILKNFPDRSVDLKNPELTVYVDNVRSITFVFLKGQF